MNTRLADRAALATTVTLGVAFAAFFLLPFAGLVARALQDGRTWEIMTGATARKAMTLSLWTSAVTVVLTIVFGTPAAYFLARASFRGKAILDGFIDLPIVLPPTVAGVALLTAFGRRGLVGEPIDHWTGITFGFTSVAVVMAQVLVSAPFYVRAAKSGFERVDLQQEQVAYTLGASRTKTFFRIAVPEAQPALVAGLVLCWARALGELGATLIFAGNLEGKTQTMPLAIISAFEGTSLGLAGAIALSLMLLAVALAVLTALRLAISRSGAVVSGR